MNGKENKHTEAFRTTKLKPNEMIELHLEGWIGEMMGRGESTQRNGQFVLTNQRACFYRKGILGEVFETIPLNKLTSVETISRMGYRCLKLHTSHDALAFKTFEKKEVFDQAYDRLEELRHPPEQPSDQPPDVSILDQLKKLGELRDVGVLTDDEFAAKKAELLARL